MSYISITNIGAHHSEAMRGLDFYKEEIKILEQRLFEVASKNNSFEARQGIEHFQNQFVIQQKNIHDLRHKYNELVQVMGEEASTHGGRVSQGHKLAEEELLSDYKSLEKIIKELRHEFNIFLAKWM